MTIKATNHHPLKSKQKIETKNPHKDHESSWSGQPGIGMWAKGAPSLPQFFNRSMYILAYWRTGIHLSFATKITEVVKCRRVKELSYNFFHDAACRKFIKAGTASRTCVDENGGPQLQTLQQIKVHSQPDFIVSIHHYWSGPIFLFHYLIPITPRAWWFIKFIFLI